MLTVTYTHRERTYTSQMSLQQFSKVPKESIISVEYPPVSPRQLRLALLQIGITPADVEQAINQLDEPHRTAAMIEWEYALEIKRDHPLIATLAEIWNQTEADVDALFLAAAGLM